MIADVNIAVVTGGGHGIGKALCERLARNNIKVVVADLDEEAAQAVAAEIDGVAVKTDVGNEQSVTAMIDNVENTVGPIDIFFSNAGVVFGDGKSGSASADGVLAPVDDRWDISWRVNVMAHVYAARARVPRMIERGGGYLVSTASAAGILSSIGDAAYSVTKHAAVGFAEALAIRHGDEGIKVSLVCPQAVATRMLDLAVGPGAEENVFGGADVDGIMSPEQVADCIVEGVANGQFLITPHPEVVTYFQRKAGDYDRWIGGMRKFRRRLAEE
ncbi:MAG: SDR family NAD(P)-dependent oxidoreductase [Gammaproteobacteria bacterium]|nr:SDR family NAD(P)-dependent oxidoreductase [Gammaproteobacteria bacterium]